MADSIHQDIVDAIIARFKTITTANGYVNNIGSNVFDHKATPFQASEVPGIDLRDTDVVEQLVGRELHLLQVEATAVGASTTPGNFVRSVKADIVKAISSDRMWSTLAEETSAVTSEPAQVQVGDKVYAAAKVRFTVEYTTANMDAYS